MDIEFHGQVDNENLIHFYSYFLYFINFLVFLLTKNNRNLNFYLDVGMSKLFLKCKFRKKRVKNDWISPGLSLNEAINFFERSLCICHQSWCWYCDINMSHRKTKQTKWPVRRVQAQVSLDICPVRSESSLSAWRSLGSLATHFVGFVVLRLNSLLCKSIKLRQLILSFFSVLWVPGWEGGLDGCVHNKRLCWF